MYRLLDKPREEADGKIVKHDTAEHGAAADNDALTYLVKTDGKGRVAEHLRCAVDHTDKRERGAGNDNGKKRDHEYHDKSNEGEYHRRKEQVNEDGEHEPKRRKCPEESVKRGMVALVAYLTGVAKPSVILVFGDAGGQALGWCLFSMLVHCALFFFFRSLRILFPCGSLLLLGRVRLFGRFYRLLLFWRQSRLARTLLFLFFERGNQDYKSYNFGERILVAFFSAVTPRTAGFNTVDLSALSDSSYLLTVLLMFVGGSSASTAGGIKITTLFVVVMGMMSVFRGKQDIEIGKRRVHNSLLRQALAITTACIFILITATLLLCTFERDNQIATLQAVLFETTSALGTVGVSLSLTPTLCVASKIVLILLMYTGRAGILTVGLAFAQKQTEARVRKPVDTLLIG